MLLPLLTLQITCCKTKVNVCLITLIIYFLSEATMGDTVDGGELCLHTARTSWIRIPVDQGPFLMEFACSPCVWVAILQVSGGGYKVL